MSYPFLDVLGSLLDNSKPLSSSDYAEFGNPNENINIYNCIESYSPYDSIDENKKYPFLYLVAGKNDYRCPIDQIAKFAKRFRELRKWEDESIGNSIGNSENKQNQ
jgi:oligopeptidase B